jgi:hypothetical protein
MLKAKQYPITNRKELEGELGEQILEMFTIQVSNCYKH